MNVLNPVIHRDDDATPIRMTRFDRLTIDGVPYILNQATSEGLYLNVDDAAGRSMFFDHEELRRLAGRKRLRMDPDFHHPERANRMNAGNRIALQDLDPKSAARLAWRSALVEALSELHAEGLVKLTDESIEASFDTIMGRAMACLGHHDMRRVQHAFKAYDNAWRPNASTLRKWRTAFAQRGLAGLLDDMAKRGGKGSRLDSGVQAILWREVSGYMHPSRPSKKRIHERICRAVEELNVGREADGLHRLGTPSRTTVRDAIAKLDRCAVHVARYGEASARKTFRAVNKGLGLTHLLERVEMDEHALDLFTMAKENDWRHMFTDEQWQKLELSKGKARFWITTAICCTSRAILGVTITPTANSSAAMKTLAMVMSDKGRWSDAVGATGSWNMYGRPETVVTDCGAAFRSEAFRFCCAELGIAAERTSAGNPEKRGRIERIFRTVSSGLCARLSGHSFSSILAKGDADPEADAALSLEDLAFVLVRWIVDIYHNTPHEGLGGETPAACWNRLAQMYGVNPSPDMERFRIAFGSRYKRSLTKAGVTILGVRYHSRTLADHIGPAQSRAGRRSLASRGYRDGVGPDRRRLAQRAGGLRWPGWCPRRQLADRCPCRAGRTSRRQRDRLPGRAHRDRGDRGAQPGCRPGCRAQDGPMERRPHPAGREIHLPGCGISGTGRAARRGRHPGACDPGSDRRSGGGGAAAEARPPWPQVIRQALRRRGGLKCPARTPARTWRPFGAFTRLRAAPAQHRSGLFAFALRKTDMPDHARISATLMDLRGIHVTSDRDEEFSEHLDRLLQRDANGALVPEPVRFGRTKETRGILIVDAAGGGKTTLASRGLDKHPALVPGEHGRRPYLTSSVPSPASLKSITSELLKQTGYDAVSSRRKVWELVDILRGRMDMLGVHILWIDEAHDLFCADRSSILRVVKSLMQGDDAVIVILSGTELLDEIVRSDPQVRRRFSVIRPAPLSLARDGQRFRDVAPVFLKRAYLSPPADPSWVPRLFHAARYRFGRAIEMLIDAVEQALLDAEEPQALELHHFGAVWAMQEGPEIERNVFLIGDWERIDPDADPYGDPPPGRPASRRRGGPRYA